MMRKREAEELREPALSIAGFQLWIHGWQFPLASDYDDANWLRVTAHCGEAGASVSAAGAILRAPDLEGWGQKCASLLAGEADKAELLSFEPDLAAEVSRVSPRGYSLRVEITPDHLSQQHSFTFAINGEALAELVRQCQAVAVLYPTRGLESSRGV